MNKPTKSIVIVGGGTAGWLTAGTIAAEHQHNPDISVTLVESRNIAPIGVGEGTWPTMRNTLMKMGIRESDFIRECDVSFKQGAKFASWVTGAKDDFYYHPLVLPQGFTKGDLAPYWQMTKTQHETSFSQAVCFQEAICELGLAPKTIRTPEYASVANYAYHLNSTRLAGFIQQHCCRNLGVKHILDDVVDIKANPESNDIEAVVGKEHGEIQGDLFVDCTGFAALLIDGHYQSPFKECSDTLFVDTALAVQVPYPDEDSPIASHTISTATSAGWIWDIGLINRRGVGHVFSSRHTSQEKAETELRAYLGKTHEELNIRMIPIRSGHRKVFWQNNCVAVGLSAGFLEPLEASALVLVELSASMIAQQLPACRNVMDIVAKRFNETFLYRWQRIIDFLKLHYLLSKRSDNDFWIDNRDPSSIPDSLKELMAMWQYRSPGDCDFTSNNEVFPAASYQYVLYGMGFESDFSLSRAGQYNIEFARDQMHKNQLAIQKLSQQLPGNRELLEKIHQHGLQTV